ncbi:methyltransferase, FkbM family [Streptoalloteichus tenebrarius]|uniref:Methyltransferase, FkbM family n=1 Tax=Streptoalloteichus tenebrarius (strain ATCC 17920 / DSM 40477 / JCM 4838 / CBS 697.72 / NBRC 16177 / NCIMB 11028 / NRRL B-12390 / A12253. 1 / ISP 5477) TaxID=1933 RepID=A0ABT1HVW1_STRSD|nr:FkbM family methyltransferase [Streptoalloteichus tenebrarius]MCP2259666.1 methyltransferase, FkbM family [Streptoalloteichus tenebrarius]BFF00643.1 FkbM family methyltransferase [Streptoalloteichus tenebrarius]
MQDGKHEAKDPAERAEGTPDDRADAVEPPAATPADQARPTPAEPREPATPDADANADAPTVRQPAPPAPPQDAPGADVEATTRLPVTATAKAGAVRPAQTRAVPPLTACTTATTGELAAVRVLGETFLTHHPGARFVALLVDVPGASAPRGGAVELLRPADIGVPAETLARLGTACTADELRAVLQPRLLTHLIASGGPVLHLDPRVLVLNRIDDLVLPALAQWPLLLSPRLLEPLARDGLRPSPEELVAAGVFDPGFLGVAPGAEPFLRSWTDLVDEAPHAAGAFLDGAPALVDHHVLRDPGIGLSVWNATQRELTRDAGGALRASGAPLRTVHLTGFDPQRPWLLSADIADRPRVLLSEHPLLAELCARYRNDLVRAGESRGVEGYRFAQLPDGSPLPAALRRQYHEAWRAAERAGDPPPPAAFRADGRDGQPEDADGFVRWACEPADDRQRAAGGSRWSAALWADDPELRRVFPDPFGTDAGAYRAWCAQHGVPGGRLHPNAVRTPSLDLPELIDQLGVAVVGTGPLADALRSAAHSSGLPTAEEPLYPVLVRCPGAPPAPTDRYVIEVRPDASADTDLRGVNELWVLSEAARRDLDALGVPVRAFPPPVPDPGEPDPAARAAARASLGLAEEHVVFVGAADHGEERRGNVLGLVSAFLTAFPDRDDVRLVLAMTSAREHPEAAERLRLATVTDPRVRLVEPSDAEVEDTLTRLLAAADCVAALHRAHDPGGSEGGGAGERIALLLAAAAARGVPVLASDHGAVSEFFDRGVAVLVPCHDGGAEPDLQSAARLLRGLAEDRETAARVGALGREHVLRTRTLAQAADNLRERVEHAYRTWRARRAQARLSQADDPLRPLLVAKHALHREPDVDAQSRIPLAPALRKAVLRVLHHYDAHLRDMMGALVDGVERTAGELLRRQDEIGQSAGLAELDGVRADLARLVERQQQLADQLVGTDDGVLRARADLAGQGRRLGAVEQVIADESARRDKQLDAIAARLDQLAGALNRTLDRIDVLEGRVAESLRERDNRLESTLRAATQAVRTTDALRRVVVREHERHYDAVTSRDGANGNGTENLEGHTSLVLCDAGLLRLPAEDGLMLPWLSSHGVWEPEVGALIDSLLEPDGVFVDVGAHVGYHTVRVLSRIGTSGAVVAVEPCARTRALLRRNVEVNVAPAVAQRFAVIGAAAWDAPGELAVEPALTGGVSVRPTQFAVAGNGGVAPNGTGATSQNGQRDGDGPEAAPQPGASTGEHADGVPRVAAVRLDKELEGLAGLAGMRLSVVKVDAPGASHRALGGLVRLLRRDRPHVVCAFSPSATAALGDDPAAALREFHTWGYDLVPLGGNAPITPQDVLDAAEAAGPGATASLWLRPKARSHGSA